MTTGSQTRVASAILDEARQLLGSPHRKAIYDLPTEARHIAGYHIGWWDEAGTTRRESGKSIRPALAVAAARAVGGDTATDSALPVATAVELVHDFSLLHDDVMDESPLRHHRAAAWTVFGRAKAVLTGDLLLGTAYNVLNQSENAHRERLVASLVQAVYDLCVGQAWDMAFESRSDVSLAEATHMVAGKTGALIGCSCELGAIAAGANPNTASVMREFGEHIGMAFQLVDDILGIWGDPQTTGKPVGSDLLARKKSLPVVAALTSGSPAAQQLAILYARTANLGESDELATTMRLVEESGGRTWAEEQVKYEIDAAQRCLDRVVLHETGTQDLLSLVQFLTDRST